MIGDWMRRGRFSLAVMLAIGTLALAPYLSALRGVFLFDDITSIVDNPSVASGVFDRGNWVSTRPLTQMSFALNHAWAGLDPVFYHWTNHLIHAIAGLFLFLWLRETFARLSDEPAEVLTSASESALPSWEVRSSERWSSTFSLLASMIWVVHPLNTQAVTYIVQRGESLMGLFFFAFLYFIAKTYQWPPGRSGLAFPLLAIGSLVLGLASKQVMLTSISVGLLYARCFFNRSWRETLSRGRMLWLAALAILIFGAVAVMPIVLGGKAGVGFQITAVSSLEYLRTQPEVILHYVRLVLWPSPLVLDYGWPPQDDPLKILLATSLVLGAVIASVVAIARGNRLAFFPIAACLVLLPTSSFIPLQDLAFEHRMYVPAAMLIAFLVGVLRAFCEDVPAFKPLLVAWGLMVVVVAGWMTHHRNLVYHSAVGMWEDVVAKTIDAGHEHLLVGRLYNNLGNAYADEERWPESLKSLELAIKEGSFSGVTYANLSRGYVATGQLEQAKAATLKAIELQPKNARVRQQLGLIAVRKGAVDEALEHFLAASRLDPNDRLILSNVAQAYLELGQHAEAEVWLEKVLAIDPKNREARKKMILLTASRGDLQNAEKMSSEYVVEYPEDADALHSRARIQLAMSAKQLESEDNVIKTLQACTHLSQSPKGANLLLADLYRRRGDLESARQHYERETQIDPRSVDAWNNLAGLMAATNKAKAIEYFEKVLSIAPEYHQAAYNIAAVQASNGQTAAAIKRLEQLLAKVDLPPAQQLLDKLKQAPVSVQR